MVEAFSGLKVQQVSLGAGHTAVIADDYLYTFGCVSVQGLYRGNVHRTNPFSLSGDTACHIRSSW